jgi:Tfp pilus assembly protein PilO
MKLGLSTRELRTVLIGGVLGIVVLYVYVGMILTSLWREASSTARRVSDARAQLAALRQATTNEAALQEQHRSLQEAVVALRGQLPSEEELPAVIEFLSGLASQTQVKIQTIFPQRPVNVPDDRLLAGQGKTPAELMVYKEIPIQIDAQASYHQLGTFLALVEASDKPMQVATLRISGNPKEPRWHNVNLSIVTYFAVREGAATDAPSRF